MSRPRQAYRYREDEADLLATIAALESVASWWKSQILLRLAGLRKAWGAEQRSLWRHRVESAEVALEGVLLKLERQTALLEYLRS